MFEFATPQPTRRVILRRGQKTFFRVEAPCSTLVRSGDRFTPGTPMLLLASPFFLLSQRLVSPPDRRPLCAPPLYSCPRFDALGVPPNLSFTYWCERAHTPDPLLAHAPILRI